MENADSNNSHHPVITLHGGPIPEGFEDLVTGPVVSLLATIGPGGEPQISPVWAEYSGDTITFTSRASTFKVRNLKRNPKLSISLIDPTSPYRYLEVRAEVIEATGEGAHEHFDRMAKRFWGVEAYPGHNYSIEKVLFKAVIRTAVGFTLPFNPSELAR